MKNTKRLNVRLCFANDDWDSLVDYTIVVPEDISAGEVQDAIIEERAQICEEIRQLENLDDDETSNLEEGDEDDAELLLDRVCKKHGWEWREMAYDIDLNFN